MKNTTTTNNNNNNNHAWDAGFVYFTTSVGGNSTGGRYSVKTRRLTLPADFPAKRVRVAVNDGVLLVVPADDNAAGARAVHPTQHFCVLPAGVVNTPGNVTLAIADVADGAPVGTCAYKLPA